MKFKIFKILSPLLACLSLVTVSGAYAIWTYYKPVQTVNGEISIVLSEFNYDPGEILYISDMVGYSSSGFSTAPNCVYSLPTNVKLTGNVESRGSSVTYKVTVFNNTDVTYWYIGQKLPAHGTNSLISSGDITVTTKEHANDSSNTFNSNDWVPARTKREFYVTYTFASNASVQAIDLLVNFYFSIRIDGVQDEFLKILNDKESSYGYYYLADEFNDKYSETKTNVIDNKNDKTVFDNLFGGDLKIDVDGTQKSATVAVQRKNVDGTDKGDDYSGANAPTGCEYTVYVTTDSLVVGQKATVYAISYSCGEDGVWYKIGQLYEGTATVVNSADGPVLDVNTWIATPKNYKVYDQIEYKVGQQYGTNYDLLKTIEEIMSTDDTEIFNKVDNSQLFKKVYDILNSAENKYSEAPEVVNLRRAFEKTAPYYDIRNGGQEIKVVRNCTRSEILPYLVELCDALEYYQTIRG